LSRCAGLLLILSLACAQARAGDTIELRGTASVRGFEVRLSDLGIMADEVSSKWADVYVCPAPAPGASIDLEAGSIEGMLEARGFPRGALEFRGAAAVRVATESFTLDRSRLEEACLRFLASQSEPGVEIESRFARDPGLVTVRKGRKDNSLSIDWEGPAMDGRVTLRMAFKADGRTDSTASVHLDLKWRAACLRAIKDVAAGSPFSPSDFRQVLMDRDSAAGAARPPFAALAGSILTRGVSRGDLLMADAVEHPDLVSPGEPVRLVVSRGRLRRTAKGVAGARAKLGQTVPVFVPSTGKTLSCRVTGRGVVEAGAP